jgi:hypothetical protein
MSGGRRRLPNRGYQADLIIGNEPLRASQLLLVAVPATKVGPLWIIREEDCVQPPTGGDATLLLRRKAMPENMEFMELDFRLQDLINQWMQQYDYDDDDLEEVALAHNDLMRRLETIKERYDPSTT